MKGKIILALSLLITFAVTSANAQSSRGRKEFDKERVSDNRHGHHKRGHISKHDRHRLAMEKRHHRKHGSYGRHDNRYGYQDRKQMHKGRKGHATYGHHRNHRRFD
ncbi:MAG: hypothetical protein EOO02_10240 [Chitinophagaceae bacterium]|nr:MAG: hypothetical protein EOO02_10240 [Chitinophagaceae bacterium]